jgi:general secretion pathway protein C
MQVILLERPNLAQTATVSLVTLGALVLFGWVLAYWTWAWVAPRPEPRAQSAAAPGGGVGSAQGLFGNLQRDQNIAAPTGIAIKLLGVVAATRGRRGYAVVQLEAREILAVREGEDIAPGIRLAEVHPDHVILVRNGVRESLAWPQKNAAAASTAPPVNK